MIHQQSFRWRQLTALQKFETWLLVFFFGEAWLVLLFITVACEKALCGSSWLFNVIVSNIFLLIQTRSSDSQIFLFCCSLSFWPSRSFPLFALSRYIHYMSILPCVENEFFWILCLNVKKLLLDTSTRGIVRSFHVTEFRQNSVSYRIFVTWWFLKTLKNC